MKSNDWKDRLGIMYSTNPDFQYNTGDEEEEETLPKEKQLLRIALDKRNRGGKAVTLVTGFRGTTGDLEALGKFLKVKCGVGGSAKDGEIIVQGDLRPKVLEILQKEGYVKSRISDRMLTVYRASAGAGKTHKLTGEYLTLLFTGPGAFRRILAVTFTNKATDEMKTRIVDELYNLASGRKSDYVELLKSTYSLTEVQVRKQAAKILIDILHDYSAFNISTIDRFFQQTMRAFTREIGLQGGYGIEMDQELVLTTAIDNLLSDLEKPESKDLLGWLLRFAEDKIESGGEWNLRKDIMALSREVFKESYKAFSEAVGRDIEDKKALEDYKNELYGIIRSVEATAKELGERGLAILNKYGLKVTDF